MKTKANVFYEGNACWVICDAMDMIGKEGQYILWCDGSPYELLKLFIRYKDELLYGRDLYFVLQNINTFKNHIELVEGTTGLYKYKRKEASCLKT